MSKRRRTTAQRNAAKRKWKTAQALIGGDQSTGAADATDSPTSPQAKGELDILQSETAFKPEPLTQSSMESVIAQGSGGFLKRSDQWDEIRAVKERYPVSRGMLERIAHETMQVVTSENAATRDRLIASKLVFAMSHGNRPDKGLPAQIEVNGNDSKFDIRCIIDAVLNDDSMGIHDTREMKIVPGDENDYAE